MIFIDPFETTAAGHRFILLIVCNFTWFVVPFARKLANVEDLLWCPRLFIAMYRKPLVFYVDPDLSLRNRTQVPVYVS